MKTIDILRIALSTFSHNKMRTFLTIFGVAIGIGAIVFLLSIGYGLQAITIDEISSIKALSTLSVTTGNSGILPLNDESLKTFKDLPGVTSANPNYTLSGQVMLDKSKTDILLNSVSAEYVDLESPKLEIGTLYSSDSDKNIVLTSLVANAFNVKPADLIGKKIKASLYVPSSTDAKQMSLVEQEYTVVGIIKDTSMSYGYIPINSINIPEGSKYSTIKLKASDTSVIAEIKKTIIDKGYKVSSLGEKINDMNRIFNIAKIILLVLGAIALMVASIGMFNTLTISLLERTRDIGIMKSLGATDREIYSIFLTESTLIGLLGGVFGLIIALVLGNLVNLSILLLANKAGGDPVKIFQAPVLLIYVILLFSVLVGFLTGVYPARRAAKLNPLDALRYE